MVVYIRSYSSSLKACLGFMCSKYDKKTTPRPEKVFLNQNLFLNQMSTVVNHVIPVAGLSKVAKKATKDRIIRKQGV